MTTTLITGATGFLGREVVRCLLAADPQLRLLCLIRAKDDTDLERRRKRLIEPLPREHGERVLAARGDIEQERLGMAPLVYEGLLEQLDRVVHVAATTNFDHTLQEARRINVGGTEHALQLARELRARGRLGRLDYVGTAYVAGDRTDVAREDELDAGQGFRNTYEQSKFEAEKRCRAAQAELPVALLRPSIIVGDSRTGSTSSYKTIYWPMKVLVGFYGLWRPVLPRLARLPVYPDCSLDIVPVDWVADGVARLYAQPEAAGRCYHLAAGPGATTIENLVNVGCDHFGVARLRYLDPDGPARRIGQALRPLLLRAAPRLTRNAELMMAYTRRNPRFDVSNTVAAGLQPPSVLDYFPRLINYAYSNDFGRAA
jgi:thioester reductase-like protein